MKTWILALVFMTGFAINAQPGERRMDGKRPAKEHREPFTAAQRAELRSKNLALKLDLNDKQQKDIEKLFFAREAEREQFMAQRKAYTAADKKPTADERFAMVSKRLDTQIAMKRDVKKILTTEQFAKYEQVKDEQRRKTGKRVENFQKHKRR